MKLLVVRKFKSANLGQFRDLLLRDREWARAIREVREIDQESNEKEAEEARRKPTYSWIVYELVEGGRTAVTHLHTHAHQA